MVLLYVKFLDGSQCFLTAAQLCALPRSWLDEIVDSRLVSFRRDQ